MTIYRWSVIFALWFSVFPLAGHGAENSSAQPQPDPAQREARRSAMGYGEGVAAVLKGTGKRQVTWREPNRHDANSADEHIAERLPGIELVWLRPGPSPKMQLLMTLEISRQGLALPQDLAVGVSTRKQIEDRFGPPEERMASSLTYHVPTDIGPDKITFFLKAGVLQKMKWQWFID